MNKIKQPLIPLLCRLCGVTSHSVIVQHGKGIEGFFITPMKNQTDEERKEKNKIRSAAWRKANPEKIKTAKDKWRLKNPEKVKLQKRRWRSANLEKIRKSKASYRARNLEKLKESENINN